MKQWISKLVTGIFVCVSISRCGGGNTSSLLSSTTPAIADSQANVSQSAVAQANADASASESSGSVGFASEKSEHDLYAACSFASARSACSGSGTDTISWNGCTIDGGQAALTGGYTETFSGTTNACTIPVTNGETLVRTSTSCSIITMASGATVTTDTNGGTAYDGTSIPNTGTSITANSSNVRSITINGTHRLMKRSDGTSVYDHFITTSSALSVSGTRANANRTIASGTIVLYHNLAHYKATTTFNNVVWGTASCCYPTSGSISSTLTGNVSGNTSMTFTSTCGQATHVDTSGNSTTVTLTQCH